MSACRDGEWMMEKERMKKRMSKKKEVSVDIRRGKVQCGRGVDGKHEYEKKGTILNLINKQLWSYVLQEDNCTGPYSSIQ
jgi:hypothetical protein